MLIGQSRPKIFSKKEVVTLINPLKFIDPEMVESVVKDVVTPIFNRITERARDCGHIVIIGPMMTISNNEFYPSKHSIKPIVIYQESIGSTAKVSWEFPFDEIAQCKALQIWQERNTPGHMSSQAHMLFEGDTPFWGAHREGMLVVGFSGIQSHYDQMICKITTATIVARAEEAKQQWLRDNPGKCFL